MNPVVRGLAAGLLQLSLLLAVGGKYLLDRATLTRTWVNVTPIDPESMLRGRYLSLQVRDLNPPVRFEFFLPERSPLAQPLQPGQQLWAEVSKAPNGLRPIRLEVRQAGFAPQRSR